MTFEWDEAKSEKTKAERGIDFAYASTIFLDDERVAAEVRSNKTEARFSAIGKATLGEILLRRLYLETL